MNKKIEKWLGTVAKSVIAHTQWIVHLPDGEPYILRAKIVLTFRFTSVSASHLAFIDHSVAVQSPR